MAARAHLWLLGLVGGFCLVTPDIGAAQSGAAAARATAVENIVLARQLATYGVRTRSALALAAAAQILLDNPTVRLDSSESPPPHSDVPLSSKALDVQTLLSEARALSGADPALRSIISQLDAASRTTGRGSGDGPRQRYAQIAGLASRTHRVDFVSNAPAVVYISGDGGTNLELGVYDSQGKLVASDVTRFGDCLVKWVPRQSGSYRVEVRNRDPTADWYLLITN
jgi:hypothetical protein